jgi:hypothetical protein
MGTEITQPVEEKKIWQAFFSHRKILSILAVIIVLAAVPLTVIISQQQQEIRQRASTSSEIAGCMACSPTQSRVMNHWHEQNTTACHNELDPYVTYNRYLVAGSQSQVFGDATCNGTKQATGCMECNPTQVGTMDHWNEQNTTVCHNFLDPYVTTNPYLIDGSKRQEWDPDTCNGTKEVAGCMACSPTQSRVMNHWHEKNTSICHNFLDPYVITNPYLATNSASQVPGDPTCSSSGVTPGVTVTPTISITPTVTTTVTPTPTSPPVICTPPPCQEGEVYHCNDTCPGGCGTVCATPTPTPTPSPACWTQINVTSGCDQLNNRHSDPEFICVDGTKGKVGDNACRTSEEWMPIAQSFCQNHCLCGNVICPQGLTCNNGRCACPNEGETSPHFTCSQSQCAAVLGCGANTGGCSKRTTKIACGDSQATPTPASTALLFSLGLDGIGATGDHKLACNSLTECGSNKNPESKTWPLTVFVLNQNNQQQLSDQQTRVEYNPNTGKFEGSISTNITPGTYTVKVKSDGLLAKTLQSMFTVTGGNNQLPSANLTTGDTDGDNQLTVLDYETIISCSVYSNDKGVKCAKSADYPILSDLNDDNKIDLIDYNLFLREFAVQSGD